MRKLPILMSPAMVLACLREIEAPGTGKTQTRRNITASNGVERLICRSCGCGEKDWKAGLHPYECRGALEWTDCDLPRIKAGDHLYVREQWRVSSEFDDVPPRDLDPKTRIRYEVDTGIPSRLIDIDAMTGRFRQAMHMPRWASRITLEVIAVNIERLHDCTDWAAISEGVVSDPKKGYWVPGVEHPDKNFPYLARPTAREMYAALWDTINGSGEWGKNPWVAVYRFRPFLRNIDSERG